MQDKINYISPETFEDIINHVPVLGIRKWLDNDIQMLYKIMYYCALRANEAINLKKEAVSEMITASFFYFIMLTKDASIRIILKKGLDSFRSKKWLFKVMVPEK